MCPSTTDFSLSVSRTPPQGTYEPWAHKYDNLSPAVRRVVYPDRELTDRFQALVSYYLFEPCFTRVGEGHDKGGVESRGKGIRLQHLVPIPQGDSLQEISEALAREIEKVTASKKDAAGRSVVEKIEEERRHLRALPIRPFDPSRLVPVSISSKSTVCIEGARYSVPSHWARLDATAYVGVDQVRMVEDRADAVLAQQVAPFDAVSGVLVPQRLAGVLAAPPSPREAYDLEDLGRIRLGHFA